MTKLNPRGSTVVDLRLASEHLSVKVEHALGAQHGIGYVEFLALYQLSQSPDRRMRRIDLASAIGRTGSGATRLLKPMEKAGWIERGGSERDARVSLVVLTETGGTLLRDAVVTMNALGKRLTQAIGDSQLDSMASALNALKG